MRLPLRCAATVLLLSLFLTGLSFGSAYNGRPKLIVVIVIDQFRGDYLERYRDQFGEGGFKLFLDHGAYFTDCNYDYASTSTGPGHASIFTGTYSMGHGIMENQWWDSQKRATVTAVHDDAVKLIGNSSEGQGVSPRNLLADTLGDELRLATQGKARVFNISFKDRAAILPGGFSSNGAYWVEGKTGNWITSTYYRGELPKWVQDFNSGANAAKYLDREWRDRDGNVLRTTKIVNGKTSFVSRVESTPFADDYEFDFARDLITYEKVGSGPATDLLTISLSANDILGHEVGPDDPQMRAMALALDRQLADFFSYLGKQFGLANVWIALSADHGVAPLPSVANKLKLPASVLDAEKQQPRINQLLSEKLGKKAVYVPEFSFPVAWLDPQAFAAVQVKEKDAERSVGEILKQMGMRDYFTRSQLAVGDVPHNDLGTKYLHSYSAYGSWFVMGVPQIFMLGWEGGTDHSSPYTYDTHVPLLFFGVPFQTGTYRTHSEPIDLAVTLASLLGINAPTHATGRVLVEALNSQRRPESTLRPPQEKSSPNPSNQPLPSAFKTQEGRRE